MTMRPPSERTIPTAGVGNPTPDVTRPEALIERVRDEYGEMPGLCLTLPQACRLWHMDPKTCTRILEGLVAERFLRRTATAAFIGKSRAPLEPGGRTV